MSRGVTIWDPRQDECVKLVFWFGRCGQAGDTASASSFDFSEASEKVSFRHLATDSSKPSASSKATSADKPTGPERGMLRPIITVRVTWSYADKRRTAAIDLVKGEQPLEIIEGPLPID